MISIIKNKYARVIVPVIFISIFIAYVLYYYKDINEKNKNAALSEQKYELLPENIKNAVFKNNNNYEIINYWQGRTFYIYLNNNNLDKTRQAAEKAFIDTLGVSLYEACQLNVYLSPSVFINSGLELKNYGLSFCPNGLPLESSSTNNQNNTKTAKLPNPILTAIVALAIMGGIIILFKFKTK